MTAPALDPAKGFVRIWTRPDGMRVGWAFVPDGIGGTRPYGAIVVPADMADGDYPLQESAA